MPRWGRLRSWARRLARPVGAVYALGLLVGVRKGSVNRLGPSEAMKLRALETEGYMDPSMVGPLNREG